MRKDEYDDIQGSKPAQEKWQEGKVFELIYGPLDGAIGVRCLLGIAIFGSMFTRLANGIVLQGNMEMPEYLRFPFYKISVSYRYKGDYRYDFERYITDE